MVLIDMVLIKVQIRFYRMLVQKKEMLFYGALAEYEAAVQESVKARECLVQANVGLGFLSAAVTCSNSDLSSKAD